ncbi:hypothetical protein [Mucilaginibacter sp.]|uniref:hypothetical protein n=1 Tax=Mucilaginibacter sp. TaxID=1882438 RepID=UPI00260FC6DF|nr:hypothetical protein [Mucilaginibacter sp.]MDB4918801.1 hypothetical protein [Mucilaginibacter sp.]
MKRRISTLPTSNVVLGYKDILGVDSPTNRLGLIKNISKDHIIAELAGLNFRLKGRFSKEVDSSIYAQQRELLYFCGGDKRLANKYITAINQLVDGKKTNLFSRQSCMFGIEEVLRSDIAVIPDYKMSPPVWEPLLQYLFCVNEHISKQKQPKEGETVTFESLNPKLLPLGESILLNDPLYIMHRGLKLMDYFVSNAELKDHLTAYFNEVYTISYERFIFELLQMFFANEHLNKDMNFYYIIQEDHALKFLFDILSKRFDQAETIKLLDIRRGPFYHRDKGHYVLADNSILLDKAYQQFINDFWFDYLKGKNKSNGKEFKFQDYKSIIGYFFEDYVREIFNYSFYQRGDYVIKMFNELKIKTKKQEGEGSDIYIRHFRKVLLAEVKSVSLYDNEKYGGTIDALYKNDRDKFFESFGVDQLVNNIKNIATTAQVVDPEFDSQNKIRIWPVIIFNDKALQAPLMAEVFNKRFRELLGSDYKRKGIYVYRLNLMHVGDLEQMQGALNKNPDHLWSLLSYNLRSRFLPPFYNTLNRNHIKHDYSIVRKRVVPIFEAFGAKENNRVKR